MTPVMAVKRQIDVDQFETILKLSENADRLLELIDGEIVEKMPTEEHGSIAANVSYELTAYARANRTGIVGVEVRHALAEDKHNSRLPDVSYSIKNRPVVRQGAVPQMPEIAVEIMSLDDTVKGLREKAEYYLTNGSQLVWLIYPRQRCVEVYTLDTIELLCGEDTLTGGSVLPDFSIPVHEIFMTPYESS